MDIFGKFRNFFTRKPVAAIGGVLLLFSLILGGAYFRERITGASGESSFFATLSDAFSSFFGAPKETEIAVIPPREGGAENASSSACSFDTLGERKPNGLALNEIAWMGTAANYNAEWIELENRTDARMDISFFQLLDRNEKIHFSFPKGAVLEPHASVLLSRKVAKDAGPQGAFEYAGALNNKGGALRLYDGTCVLLDEALFESGWPAGDNASKRTMERMANGAWRTSAIAGGTPGAKNSGGTAGNIKTTPAQKSSASVPAEPSHAPSESVTQSVLASETVVSYPALVINEIFVGSDAGAADEFIELWNPGDEAVSLSGWSLKKKSSTGSATSLVSASKLEGKSVPAKSFFVIGNEGGYRGPADAGWAKSNTLAYSNNAVLLLNPQLETVHEVSWTEIPKGKSFSRGMEGNFTPAESTPGRENVSVR
jgi:hypothetical protein